MFTKASKQHGVTLIELIVSMAIIGVAAVAVMQLFDVSGRSSAEPVRRKQALLIAEAVMDEVLTARYTFCDAADDNVTTAQVAALDGSADAGGLAGCATQVDELGAPAAAARPFFNVNDYYVDGGRVLHDAQDRVIDAAGNPINVPGYQAVVMIQPAVTIGPAAQQIVSTNAALQMEVLQITVTVTDTVMKSNVIELQAYRTRYAPRAI